MPMPLRTWSVCLPLFIFIWACEQKDSRTKPETADAAAGSGEQDAATGQSDLPATATAGSPGVMVGMMPADAGVNTDGRPCTAAETASLDEGVAGGQRVVRSRFTMVRAPDDTS